MSTDSNVKKYQNRRSEKKLPKLLSRSDFRVDLSIENTCKSSTSEDHAEIRIMQWNILAQALTCIRGGDNFVYCPTEALKWDNRKLHIMEEILTYNATVVCLQEVDNFKYMEEELSKAGYIGTFFPKPDSPCLNFRGNFGPDGCALFWKSDLIDVVNIDTMVIEVDEFLTNQVCLLATMKMKQSGTPQEFIVSVTHLKSKSGYHQLRHKQSQYIVEMLKKFGDIPVILCGDFNSEPSEKAYMEIVSSDLNLVSAYTYLSETREEPPYTTIKVRNSPVGTVTDCRTIDYIFFNNKKFVPTSIVKFPTKEEIGDKMLPSFDYPSDHLSLICNLKFLE